MFPHREVFYEVDVLPAAQFAVKDRWLFLVIRRMLCVWYFLSRQQWILIKSTETLPVEARDKVAWIALLVLRSTEEPWRFSPPRRPWCEPVAG